MELHLHNGRPSTNSQPLAAKKLDVNKYSVREGDTSTAYVNQSSNGKS